MDPSARRAGPRAPRRTPAAVALPQGRLLGAEQEGVLSFKGIPYAAAPFAEHRFAAPAPPPAWEGDRMATDYGPTAPKPPYPAPIAALLPDPVIPGAECLNLNIWTPGPDGGRPVLVWIHGGAFTNGSGAVAHYDGSAFARDGIVCVTVNYRLGVEGFAAIEGAPVNRGLLDQIAALRWVRDNIRAFGGDPTRVTIAGESAGAMSVTALLTMPSARGLFHGAITQSGAGHHALQPRTAAAVTAALAATLRIPESAAGFAQVPAAELVRAQARLAARIATDPHAAGTWGEIARNMMAFEPVIDGQTLPALPITSIESGAGSDVAVLTGTNTDEHALFLVPSGAVDRVDAPTLAATVDRLGADPQACLAAYRADLPSAGPGGLLVAILSDWFFRLPAVRVAEARRRLGADTYVYEFGWRSPALRGRLGACHALEIAFAFDTPHTGDQSALLGTDPPQALADEMHAAWVRFVRTGNPGWPAYGGGRTVRYFGEYIETRTDSEAGRREVWDSIR